MRHAIYLLILLAAAAHAQLTRGSISGHVEDASHRLVAGVQVSATNQSTSAARGLLTDNDGFYRFSGLEPGVYDLEFKKLEFSIAKILDVALDAAEDHVVNAMLAIAARNESVTVEAQVADVDLAKGSASIDRTLPQEFLEKSPVPLHDVTYLMALGPTSVHVPGSPEFHYVASGQRPGQTGFLADGLDNRGYGLDFPVWSQSPEQVSEVQVKANPYSAEFGRTMGVVVSTITRSGGNQFHGSLWDYYTGSWASAVSLADKRAGLAPNSQEHFAGANAGGPIKRNRTFFFGYFQDQVVRGDSGVRVEPAAVFPTAKGFADLQQLPAAPGMIESLGFLRDVYPKIRRYEATYQIPFGDKYIEFGSAHVPAPLSANWWNALGRVDHYLTFRDLITARLESDSLSEDMPQSGRAGLSNNYFGDVFANRDGAPAHNALASYTHVSGPSAVNEFRIGGPWGSFHSDRRATPGPFVVIPGFFNSGDLLGPIRSFNRTVQLQNVLTIQRGRHALKFGADTVFYRNEVNSSLRKYGIWVFFGFDHFLNNAVDYLEYNRSGEHTVLHHTGQAYFVQDDFRVSRRLTLNIGARYQIANTPLDVWGTNDPTLLAAGLQRPVRRDINDIAPRFGFAWSPGDRTVVRGGYGIGYEQVPGVQLLTFTFQPPEFLSGGPAAAGLFPNLPTDGAGPAPIFPAFQAYTSPSPDAKNPTTHFYNVSVQQQLGTNQYVEVGYTGNRSYHQWRYNETNPGILTPDQAGAVRAAGVDNAPPIFLRRVNPAWNSRGLAETAGLSRYDAAYVRFDRRFSRGVLFGAMYTWSGTFDDGFGAPQDIRNFRREWARADIDRPHHFSAHWVWHVRYGFQLAGYAEIQSGQPFNITTGVDSNGDGAARNNTNPDRPNYNPAGFLALDSISHDWRSFRTDRFVTPRDLSGGPLADSMPFGGNLGRNALRGPRYANTSLSVLKEFSIGERTRIELRASWNNLFNHRNFDPPVSLMASPDFGTNQSNAESRATTLVLRVRF
jgi:Carboxypeptidase regulatory-like domain